MMIINADDFGYSSEINRAIVESFHRGYCSSTTLMANMQGFEEACSLIHEKKLLNHTGIHLVLTEGVPLTDKIKKSPRFCNSDGIFNMSRKVRFWVLSADEKKAVAEELRAQIAKCRKNGITLTHADSHRHAHEEWAIAAIVIDICREEKIPYFRLTRNCGQGSALAKRMYRHFLNQRIRKAGLARTRYFGSAKDVFFLLEKRGVGRVGDSIEVMVHPGFDSRGSLIDWVDGSVLSDTIGRLKSGSSAVSFSGHNWVE